MQFHVPQFIDVEDKIFGPFTLKQFIYLGGSAGFLLFLYSFFSLILTIIIGAPVIALGVSLAFVKVNNRPFINVLESAFRYITKSRVYIWKREPKEVKASKKSVDDELGANLYIPKLSDSKLKDLAWSLDIKEKQFTDINQQEN